MNEPLLHLFINVICSSANPNTSVNKINEAKDPPSNSQPLKILNNGVYNKIYPITTTQNTAVTPPPTNLSFASRCYAQISKLCRPTILGRTEPPVPETQPVKLETVPFRPDYRTARLKQFFLKFLLIRKINAYLLNVIPRGIWYEPLKTINKPIQNVNDLNIDQTLVFREFRRDGRKKNKKIFNTRWIYRTKFMHEIYVYKINR